jgi:hypothetical protein
MSDDFPETENRRMHSRIAHTRALKDNARLVSKQEEKDNHHMPMKFDNLLRTAAVNEHHSVASDHTPLLIPL